MRQRFYVVPSYMASPYLSILVLNYNGYEDTIACLESVFRAARKDYEIVVIDNASSDGSVEKLLAWGAKRNPPVAFTLPRGDTNPRGEAQGAGGLSLTLIQSPANLGFSGGNNVGIR